MEISEEDDLETGDDHLVYFWDRNIWKIGHLFPTSTFIEQGIITWHEHPGADMSASTHQFLAQDVFRGRQKPVSHPLFTDQEVLDHIGPSRIPPRVAPQAPPARLAIETEIPDLLKSESGRPPALI